MWHDVSVQRPSSTEIRPLAFGVACLLALGAGSCANVDPPACDNLDLTSCNTVVPPAQRLRDFRQTNRALRPTVGAPIVGVRNVVITAVDIYAEPGGDIGDAFVQEVIPESEAASFQGCIPVMTGGRVTSRVCGIQLFRPRYIPVGSHPLPGDLLSISGGRYDEFNCQTCAAQFSDMRTLPELSQCNAERIGSGAVPAPIDVTITQVIDGGDAYVGVLVRLTDTFVTGPVNPRQGEIPLTLATAAPMCLTDGDRCTRSSECCSGGCAPDRGTTVCGAPLQMSDQLTPLNNSATGMPLAQGTRVRNVVGIVSYFFGTKIIPRSVRDYEIVS